MSRFLPLDPEPHYDDCDRIEDINRGTEGFIMSFFRDSTKSRTRLLELLHVAMPWFSPTNKDRARLVSDLLAPMMRSPSTSQREHSLLPMILIHHVFRGDSSMHEKHLVEFAKGMHIMLEERRDARWFYLDCLGAIGNYGPCGEFARLFDCIITALQHFGSHFYLLETLESESDEIKLSITLCLISCFAEHDRLTSWDEDMQFRLLFRMHATNGSTHIGLVACVLANLDLKELAKFPIAPFIEKIALELYSSPKEQYVIIGRVLPLMERLSSSPEFQKHVTSSVPLLITLLDEWRKDDLVEYLGPSMKHLWGIWASLADWIASSSTHSFFLFAKIAEEKLKNYGKYREYSQNEEMDLSYFKLMLKVRECIMDPANIRFTQDSISRKFQDGTSV